VGVEEDSDGCDEWGPMCPDRMDMSFDMGGAKNKETDDDSNR